MDLQNPATLVWGLDSRLLRPPYISPFTHSFTQQTLMEHLLCARLCSRLQGDSPKQDRHGPCTVLEFLFLLENRPKK